MANLRYYSDWLNADLMKTSNFTHKVNGSAV